MFDLDDYSASFAVDCATISKGICEEENEEYQATVANVISNKYSLLVSKTENLSASERTEVFKNVRFGWKDVAKIVFKVLVHKVFRLVWFFEKRHLKRNSPRKVFKAWVEVNVDSWGEEYSSRDSCVLVLPFPLKLSRQLTFIRRLWEGDVQFSLYGYAYSLKNMLRYIIRRDVESLARLENSATESYSQDILALGVAEVFHMDDVEVQSYVANNLLMREGVSVRFRSHGIGRYSAFFTASSAVFFNESQRDYYEALNSFRDVELLYPIDRCIAHEKSDLRHVIFVSQLINGMPAEYEGLEQRVLEKLSVLSKELDFSLAVKLHPNGRNAEFLKAYPCVNSLELSTNCSTIFFTNYSTSYYTFEQYGPTYLIRSAEVDPSIFFGNEEHIVNETAFSDSASFIKAIFNKIVLFDNISGQSNSKECSGK